MRDITLCLRTRMNPLSLKLLVVGAFNKNFLDREENKSKAPLFESCFWQSKDYMERHLQETVSSSLLPVHWPTIPKNGGILGFGKVFFLKNLIIGISSV